MMELIPVCFLGAIPFAIVPKLQRIVIALLIVGVLGYIALSAPALAHAVMSARAQGG